MWQAKAQKDWDTVEPQCLEHQYALSLATVQPFDHGYLVFSSQGAFHLRLTEDEAGAFVGLRLLDYLQTRGWEGTTPLRSTRDGALAFRLGSRLAYLTVCLGGRCGDLGLGYDVMRLSRLLVGLHLLSQDLPRALRPADADLESHCRQYLAKEKDLALFQKMALHRLYPTAFDVLFLQAYERVSTQAAKSAQVLANGQDVDVTGVVTPKGLIRVGCKHDEMWVTDNGIGYWRSLSGCVWGPLILDVVDFLSGVGGCNRWSPRRGQKALAFYESVRPLQPQERRLAYGLGVFPGGVWQVAHGYYRGNREPDHLAAVADLQDRLHEDRSRMEYWQSVLGVEWAL